jgi:hypothetical protein
MFFGFFLPSKDALVSAYNTRKVVFHVQLQQAFYSKFGYFRRVDDSLGRWGGEGV